jgi:hypothetical protein
MSSLLLLYIKYLIHEKSLDTVLTIYIIHLSRVSKTSKVMYHRLKRLILV